MFNAILLVSMFMISVNAADKSNSKKSESRKLEPTQNELREFREREAEKVRRMEEEYDLKQNQEKARSFLKLKHPLHSAIEDGASCAVVRLLLEAKSSVNVTNDFGKTPIWSSIFLDHTNFDAINGNSFQITQLLLDQKACVDYVASTACDESSKSTVGYRTLLQKAVTRCRMAWENEDQRRAYRFAILAARLVDNGAKVRVGALYQSPTIEQQQEIVDMGKQLLPPHKEIDEKQSKS